MESTIDRWFGAVSAVVHSLYRLFLVKELNQSSYFASPSTFQLWPIVMSFGQ